MIRDVGGGTRTRQRRRSTRQDLCWEVMAYGGWERSLLVFSVVAALLFDAAAVTWREVLPWSVPYLPTLTDRIIYAIRWQLLPASVLFLAVLVEAWTSFGCSTNTVSSPVRGSIRREDSSSNRRHFIQTTAEQLSLAIFGSVVVATYVEEDLMQLVPVVNVLFTLGRFLYWISPSSIGRGFGFVVALAPVVALFGYGLFFVFSRGPGLRLGRPPIY